jgi:hypothetical protein
MFGGLGKGGALMLRVRVVLKELGLGVKDSAIPVESIQPIEEWFHHHDEPKFLRSHPAVPHCHLKVLALIPKPNDTETKSL